MTVGIGNMLTTGIKATDSSLMSWKFEFMGEVTTTKKKIPMICNLVSLVLVIVFIIKIPIQLYVPDHKL